MRRDNPNAEKPSELQGHDDEPPWFPWVWRWFCAMRPGVSWIEIEAWSRLTGIKPTSWECQLLIDLDKVRR